MGFTLLFLVFGVRRHGKPSPRQCKDYTFIQNTYTFWKPKSPKSRWRAKHTRDSGKEGQAFSLLVAEQSLQNVTSQMENYRKASCLGRDHEP